MWVKSHQPDSEKQDDAQTGPRLKIAGADGVKHEDAGIGVLISSDKDEATRRRERDEQAQAKRQQNTLPEWHRVSTVSGHMTRLGNEEQARANKDASGAALPASSSNDDILRGLGMVGVASGKGKGDRRGMITNVDKDVKPVIDQNAQCRHPPPSLMCFPHRSVDWDQYYASLESSAQATPTGLSAPGSSDFGDIGENDEEDIKPSVEYLDSLNEYRKRSRSNEGTDTANKLPKVEDAGETTTGHLNGTAEIADVAMEEATEEPKDDPIVYGELTGALTDSYVPFLMRIVVNGTPMPYSQVTEAEHDLMTPDEYTAFFQIMQEQM
jgi:transcription initiation factor TFIIE subunit alpha